MASQLPPSSSTGRDFDDAVRRDRDAREVRTAIGEILGRRARQLGVDPAAVDDPREDWVDHSLRDVVDDFLRALQREAKDEGSPHSTGRLKD